MNSMVWIVFLTIFVFIIMFIVFVTLFTIQNNKGRCNCEGFETSTGDAKQIIVSNITNMTNTLHNMANEIIKIREWLVVHNDTMNREASVGLMTNMSGNLNNMSSEISKLSALASTYAATTGNSFVAQYINTVANDLGNQSISLNTASNNMMVWAGWVQQFNRMNDIPGLLTATERDLRQLAVYLTMLLQNSLAVI